jgi:hypothetical protein
MKSKQRLREKISNYICVVMLLIYTLGGINEIKNSIIGFNNGVISRNIQ